MHKSNRKPKRYMAVAAPLAVVALVALIAALTPNVANMAGNPGPALENAVPDATASGGNDNDRPAYEEGVVLARLSRDASAESLSASLAQASSVVGRPLADGDVAAGFAKLEVREGSDVASAIDELGGIAGVEGAQPNYLYYFEDEPLSAAGTISALASRIDDELASSQWHLDGANGINASGAWDVVTGGELEKPVTVAIVDTGCETTHADLAGNIIGGYSACDPEGSFEPAPHDENHGTHVGGIVAAVSNNGAGVSGVSHNARIMPIRVVAQGTGTDTICLKEAFDYITSHQAEYNIRVANVSLGGFRPSSYDQHDVLMLEALKEASASTLFVTAAGNQASNKAFYPGDNVTEGFDIVNGQVKAGDYSEPLGLNVIALGEDGARDQGYSNYNAADSRAKDISAPGTSILSTVESNGYGIKRGTSMAAPIVAGVAALVFSANPSLSPREVIDVLHRSATDLGAPGFDADTGYGEVNAAAAVRAAIRELDGASSLSVGESSRLAAGAGDWTWRTSDDSVATVSEEGIVTGAGTGTATIVAVSGTARAYKDIEVVAAQVDDPRSEGSGEPEPGSRSESESASEPESESRSESSSQSESGSASESASEDSKQAGPASGAAGESSSASEGESASAGESAKASETASETGRTSENAPSPAPTVSPGGSNRPAGGGGAGTISKPASPTASATGSAAASGNSKGVSASESASAPASESESEAASDNAAGPEPETTTSSSGTDAALPPSQDQKPPIPDASKATIDAIGRFTYTGRPITPVPTVRIGDMVVDPSHYSVDYEANRYANEGTGSYAWVIVKGKGDYRKIFVSTSFVIAKAPQSIAIKTKTGAVSALLLKNTPRAVSCMKRISGMKGQLVYKKQAGSKRLAVDAKTGLVTVKQNTKAGTYKISVKAYAKAAQNYTRSKAVIKTFKVKVK